MKAKPSVSNLMTIYHRIFVDAFEAISQVIYIIDELPSQNENGDLTPGEKLFLTERLDALIAAANQAKQDFSGN